MQKIPNETMGTGGLGLGTMTAPMIPATTVRAQNGRPCALKSAFTYLGMVCFGVTTANAAAAAAAFCRANGDARVCYKPSIFSSGRLNPNENPNITSNPFEDIIKRLFAEVADAATRFADTLFLSAAKFLGVPPLCRTRQGILDPLMREDSGRCERMQAPC